MRTELAKTTVTGQRVQSRKTLAVQELRSMPNTARSDKRKKVCSRGKGTWVPEFDGSCFFSEKVANGTATPLRIAVVRSDPKCCLQALGQAVCPAAQTSSSPIKSQAVHSYLNHSTYEAAVYNNGQSQSDTYSSYEVAEIV